MSVFYHYANRKQEIPIGRRAVLQTKKSREENQPGDEEGASEPAGHSTWTLSKVAGATLGSNRGSKVIIVKMASLAISEIIEVWDQVWNDIKTKNRQKKSLCTFSLSSGKKIDPNNLPAQRKQQKAQMKVLLDNDVPIVVSAGNHAEKDGGRPDVDTAPGVFEGPDFPLIVIGNCDSDGKKVSSSQAGPHLTIWAPGNNVPCLDPDPNAKDPTYRTGTSYCKPTLLSSESSKDEC